ncbi:hypothetical protein HJC23_003020 [Cyclotella cryptica]|uniref:Uncharacterized protein n=1 Tax=Cyclotella cryptica TaxID=29204 RepID=A0ABD3PUW7_9STRA|eukprot:CCRYP_011820-RA/>CCRYP_011820-RA protein AED:0.14 eAED:0.14 QI:0/-1/0/1/-1/1/1/0/323
MSLSPPPILHMDLPPPSATSVMSPAYIPAAPPGTPYTPFSKADAFPPLPGTPHSPTLHKLRPSPPPLAPPFANNEQPAHYTTLLHQYQSAALTQEKTRVSSLQEHEAHYTTIDEYRHALARERRHALSLVQELSYYKFNARYQSCLLYSEAEINEEAKVNLLIKSMESVIKEKNEEKVRTVMELEREEERMINVLMERLERVNREKGMLERQIYGCGGVDSTVSRFERMEGVERVDVQQQVPSGGHMQVEQPHNEGEMHDVVPSTESRQEFSEVQQIENDSAIAECEEDAEEEEGDDILEDKYHDPDMEMELDSLLEKKGMGN